MTVPAPHPGLCLLLRVSLGSFWAWNPSDYITHASTCTLAQPTSSLLCQWPGFPVVFLRLFAIVVSNFLNSGITMHMLIQMMAWWLTKGHAMTVSFLDLPAQRVCVTWPFNYVCRSGMVGDTCSVHDWSQDGSMRIKPGISTTGAQVGF